jgi:predicted phosphodiesterase
MRIAVISDIHGNLDAMQPVLADIDAVGVDQIICLGDCVGYGAESDQVVHHVRARQIPTVAGNHEMAVTGQTSLDWFNPTARKSLQKTMTLLSPETMDFLNKLPTSLVLSSCRFVHGYPPDSTEIYLFQQGIDSLKQTLASMQERICFVGHTHDLEIVRYRDGKVERDLLDMGEIKLESVDRYIINVGSVGQPRDGDNRAKYAVYDQENETVVIKFIPYDIAAAANKIIHAGLPEAHANRLW